jgi:hypothetical protein
MDWLFSRVTIITLAVLGGIFAFVASSLQARGLALVPRARKWNVLAYIFMAASMALFIAAGFRGVAS